MQEHFSATEDKDFQHLLSLGFSDIEATRLVHMKNNVSDQIEYREMLEESRRLKFMRWLIEHDRMSG